ncbi:hypothetical protein [Mycobacterium simiae]|uniref:hypothetical protein n=1 Tax=Mycobacterium simiae TaxID=1784 RepID=UPI0004237D04|nr:hypothetical protein [Mycobacterium simiae]PLV44943.1 hypothetical protein X011_25640 [Mycobacterium tuberculosis variant microti OV254]BBX38924.1 hypothetical protein MSIM_03750 [Mycobacterium simiae]
MTDDYAVKAATHFLYTTLPAAVEEDPAAEPLTTIAKRLVTRLTDEECRVLLQQLVSHRVATCQQVRSHARHQVSAHD